MIKHKEKVAAGLRALTAKRLPVPALFLYMEYNIPPLPGMFGIPVFSVAPSIIFDDSRLVGSVQYVPVWPDGPDGDYQHGTLMRTYCEAYCDAPEDE